MDADWTYESRAVTPEQLQREPHAEILEFSEVRSMLTSPDSGKLLSMSEDEVTLSDGRNAYPVLNGVPILYPSDVSAALLKGGLDMEYYSDSRKQYFLLSQIKQRGEINAPSGSIDYQRHLFRMKEFLFECRGSVLDVGCDDVEISASLFNENCSYVGLDPFSTSTSGFRVVGVGECLPFTDNSFDNVVFNTSLDHILDHHTALLEAMRVLKPSGKLYLATLVWTHRATLLTDSVHFHHFREYEILGALGAMRIDRIKKYQYKDDEHRCAFFVSAEKA